MCETDCETLNGAEWTQNASISSEQWRCCKLKAEQWNLRVQAVFHSPACQVSHLHFNSTEVQPASPRHPVTNYCKHRAITSLAASDVIKEAGASIHADLTKLCSLIFTRKTGFTDHSQMLELPSPLLYKCTSKVKCRKLLHYFQCPISSWQAESIGSPTRGAAYVATFQACASPGPAVSEDLCLQSSIPSTPTAAVIMTTAQDSLVFKQLQLLHLRVALLFTSSNFT